MQLEIGSLKKIRLQRESNPWPPRYRCDALPTELWSHTLGARSIVGSHFPVRGVKRCKVYEIIHIWAADIDESEKWSSQWIFQFMQLEIGSLKKIRLQRESNPWPPRYRCDALPTELWSHTLGARSIVGSHFPVRGVKRCKVYEIIHIWAADIDESEKWSSQWIFQFMQLEIGSLKKIRLQRESNPWPPRYRCDALPTELWSHTLGARSIVGSHFPVRGVKRCKVYEIIHIWAADIDESEKWSSQWIFQFMQLEIGSLKKIRLQRESNPWPPRYRCDALPTELWSHTLGARSIVGSHFPVRGVKRCKVYEIIHIWAADIDESEKWSSQWIFQFMQLEIGSLKKIRLQRESNPWPPRYRCDALPTELWSHTLGARSIVGSHFPVRGVKRCKVYEIIHIWAADIDESEKWSSQWIFQFMQLEIGSLKKIRLQRESNPWPPRYRCDALPTELWSHTLGARSIVGSHFPVRGVKRCKVYEIIHIWAADIDESEKWSSQWIFQFMQLEIGSLKKIRLQRESNPWPPRYRCDALPTELWSHTLGARSIVGSHFPVRGVKRCKVYEIIHIWAADIDESEKWSSQWIFQFMQLEIGSLKKIRLQRESNPWPPRYRCDALPTELWSHTLGARSIVGSHFPVRGVKRCKVYEIIHIWAADIDESEKWSSQWIFQFMQLEIGSLKKIRLQRESNPWPPRYRCDALPTELWSHTLGARSIVGSHFPVRGVKRCKVYEIIHIWAADIDESEKNQFRSICGDQPLLKETYEQLAKVMHSVLGACWKKKVLLSNKSYSGVISCGILYYIAQGGLDLLVFDCNPKVWLSIWKLLSVTSLSGDFFQHF